MKKFFFIAVAVMAIAACTKTEVNTPQNLISFQPASQLNTKVTGSVFPQTETFGAFAWTAGTSTTYFIDNNVVSFSNGQWSTATPYYWPKNQTVDFFCYYPFDTAGSNPTVLSETQIKYDVDFSKASSQVDYMYADKAVGYTDNADQVQDDGQNALEGVPTIFRHAGAKVTVNVVLGDNEKSNPGDNVDTKWEVKLKSVRLSGLYIKGTCEMNLSSTTATGMVPWTKPAGNVWTPDETITNSTDNNTIFTDVQERPLEKGIGQNVIPTIYVLPQALTAGQQKITIVCEIKTYRKATTATEYPTEPFLVQNNATVTADLLIPAPNQNAIEAWEMNHNIVYNITLGPAGSQITFDPAVDNWVNENVSTNIELTVD